MHQRALQVKHCAQDLGMVNAFDRITIYNDNQACVAWYASLTNKAMRYINLREYKVHEAAIDGNVRILSTSQVPSTPAIFSPKNSRMGPIFDNVVIR